MSRLKLTVNEIKTGCGRLPEENSIFSGTGAAEHTDKEFIMN